MKLYIRKFIFDFYLLGVTSIFIHDMDAVRCQEWRISPGL